MTRSLGTTLGLGVLGVLCGLVVGAVLFVAFESALHVRDGVIRSSQRIEDTVMVIVAARDVVAGHRWTEEDLVAIETPVWMWRDGWIDDPELVVGMQVTADTFANEFVRAERIALPDDERADGLALAWSLHRCARGVRGAEGCGGVRPRVEALVREGRHGDIAALAVRFERLELFPPESPVLAALYETGTVRGPLPPASPDLPPWRLVHQFDFHHDHAVGCARARVARDPSLPPLTDRVVRRADLVGTLTEWSGDRIDDAELQRWGSRGPFVECVGAVPLTVERLAELWVEPAPQSSR